MSFPQRLARHIPADASLDAHSPSLAYAYKSSETTTWTIRHGQTADYVFRSRTTRQTSWSYVEPGMETRGSLRMEQVMEALGSLCMEEPEAPRNHDHRNITDSHRSVRGPPNRDSRPPEYSRPRNSNRKYGQGGYNSRTSRPQGQRSHSYLSGEESDHKSSKHRCDNNSSQSKFQSGHKTSRSQYSNDRSRRGEYEPDTNIKSSRRDGDYGRSNKHESGRTSNQNHYNSDSGRSRKYESDYKASSRHRNEDNSRSSKYESDYKASSRHRNEDNSRSNKYKTKPRYEKARPKTCATIEEEEEDLPNYYAMLGISSFASPDEIGRAAKLKRVEVHPDKCVKPDMSEGEKAKAYEIAAAVGQAADVLTDAELKWRYDKKVAHKW